MGITKHRLEEAFVGAVTVGERGQIVIPSDAREALGIEAGDKLLVFTPPHGHMIMLTSISNLEDTARDMQQVIEQAVRDDE